MTYDLIVIGAGPAGCATAIKAARSGACVLLLDRGHFPRHKVCGEFVSAESLNLLASLLSAEYQHLATVAPRISHARVFADHVELCFEINPAAASISRFELDRALWHSCLQSGVDCRENCSVQALAGQGPFSLTTTCGQFHSRAIVNAAGRWSFLTSPQTRARATEKRRIGVKAHFRERHSSNTVDLYFFKGGYCGVQPVRGEANGSAHIVNACAMVEAEKASELKNVFSLHPALRQRSANWELTSQAVSTAPLIFHKPEPVQGNMLQVGDAATFVDPFIGDGISLALRSGALAAECLRDLVHGKATLQRATSQYEKLYSQRLAPVFLASSLLRNLLRVPAPIRKPAMSLLRRTPSITRKIVEATR